MDFVFRLSPPPVPEIGNRSPDMPVHQIMIDGAKIGYFPIPAI